MTYFFIYIKYLFLLISNFILLLNYLFYNFKSFIPNKLANNNKKKYFIYF